MTFKKCFQLRLISFHDCRKTCTDCDLMTTLFYLTIANRVKELCLFSTNSCFELKSSFHSAIHVNFFSISSKQ